MPTSSGQAGFSILLFQDVAAIPMLALLPLLALCGLNSEHNDAVAHKSIALGAIKSIAFIVGVIGGGRLLLRPVLRWIANSGTPEIFTAASLLLVVGIAALMQAVGLSMALGAFLAGVLLAESEYRRELETDIEPFKGLRLGLFFIAVGMSMSIDFGVLRDAPGLMAAILVGFLGLKLVLIYGLSALMKLPYQERAVFVVLLAQGIAPTVLDHDAEMVESVRAFGYRVFYGDATRLDLLRTAGATTAAILVVAVDDVGQSLRIVDLAKEHFPHLQIVARARDVTHWNALRDRGVMRVERELFESSLRSARGVLELLGHAPEDAKQSALRFRQHNWNCLKSSILTTKTGPR